MKQLLKSIKDHTKKHTIEHIITPVLIEMHKNRLCNCGLPVIYDSIPIKIQHGDQLVNLFLSQINSRRLKNRTNTSRLTLITYRANLAFFFVKAVFLLKQNSNIFDQYILVQPHSSNCSLLYDQSKNFMNFSLANYVQL